MLSELGTTDAFEFYRTFIEWFVSRAPMKYLEIGAHTGGLTARISMLDNCISATGIDIVTYPDWPKYTRAYPKVELIEISSDAFFEKNDQKFGCIFIDGDHSKEQVATDIHNAYKVLASEGIIILHDTVPPDEEHKSADKCGTASEVIEHLPKSILEIFTFPVRYGMTIVRSTV